MQADGKQTEVAQLTGNQDTSFLKILALCLMMVDHLGVAFFTNTTELRVIGRMALPLYAWCLVVGSVKTRNIFRYGLRLLLLGAVSQPIYMMALSHSWLDLNILFALLIGLIAIYGIQRHRFGSQIWVPALCFVLHGFLRVDYGWRGLAFILVLYLARENRGGLIAAYLAFAMFWGSSGSLITQLFGVQLPFLAWTGIGAVISAFFHMQSMVWLSLPLIALPTHTGFKMPQWLGYALYPMHLVVIVALRLWVGGADWAMLVSRF